MTWVLLGAAAVGAGLVAWAYYEVKQFVRYLDEDFR